MARYGLLTYKAHPEYNVGDYIQSLAAAQYLPRVDEYINREKLSSYNKQPLKLIMNGWFMHLPQNWPPSTKIEPLLTSFHLNAQAKDRLLHPSSIEWFKKHGPVGCRDLYTFNLLQQKGVEVYYSGCLTSTLQNKWNYRTEDVYFADVLFRVPDWQGMGSSPKTLLRSIVNGDILNGSNRKKLLNKLFEKQLLLTAKHITHYHTARHTEQERFQMAECFLEKYATAKLVVTSRLHCAIPCLAFGTPVIFVDAGFSKEEDTCRLNGMTELFNTITIDNEGNANSNFAFLIEKINGNMEIKNPDAYRTHVPVLTEACRSFVNEVPLLL